MAVRPSRVGANTKPMRGATLTACDERLSWSNRTPRSSVSRGRICQLSCTKNANSFFVACEASGLPKVIVLLIVLSPRSTVTGRFDTSPPYDEYAYEYPAVSRCLPAFSTGRQCSVCDHW